MIINMPILACWTLFFLSPLFWPKIMDSYIAMDLLAFATALMASALMLYSNPTAQTNRKADKFSWLFLGLLLFPIALQLTILELRNPWRAWQMALYITSAWLIFRMAGSSARKMLGCTSWFVLLAMIGNFYVTFALLQEFQWHLWPGFEVFPFWLSNPERFGGPLIHPNLESLFLALICMALWSQFSSTKRSWPWLLASLLPCAGLLATSSRSSALVMALGIVILLATSQHRTRFFVGILTLLAVSSAMVNYWMAVPSVASESVSLVHRLEVSGFQSRLFLWDMSIRLFMDHFWLGIGAGNLLSYGTEAHIATLVHHPEWSVSSVRLSGGDAWTHNLPLQFLVEWGIFGGIAIIALLLAIIFKAWQLLVTKNVSIVSAEAQAALGLLVLMAHGMVSVAVLQGFFLVLIALYASALFIKPEKREGPIAHNNGIRLVLMLIPSIFLLYSWQSFITKELAVERAVGLPIQSEAFITPMASGIDSPWSSRPALFWYFVSLGLRDAKPPTWIQSEPLAYRFWLQHQSSLSLRYLILIAHLKDDIHNEKHLIELYQKAYPSDSHSNHFVHHIERGHLDGEAIDIWK